MTIDLLRHPELIFGAVGAEKTVNGIKINRMTAALFGFYGENEYNEIRANCSAGARICFSSDTEKICMSLKFGRTAREIFAADVIIDRTQRCTFVPDAEKDTCSFVVSAPSAGIHRYEIFLPNLCESEIVFLEVDDGSMLVPGEYTGIPMIFIGDSITQGMTVTGPSLSYAARLSRMLDCPWSNLSIGGAVMKGELGIMAQDYCWQSAVIAYGCNDFCLGRELAEFEADTRQMFSNLSKRQNCRIFAVTPIAFLQDTPANAEYDISEYRKCISAVGKEFDNVTVIDGLSLIPAEEKFFVDGCHPNDEGMKIMAQGLYKFIS